MSVLICSICEENRAALTKVVEDINNSLGQRCSGKNKAFAAYACADCGSKAKLMTFGLTTIQHTFSINDKGEYIIELTRYASGDKLASMNYLKKIIDEFEVTSFIENEFVSVQGYLLKCVCGYDGFNFSKVQYE